VRLGPIEVNCRIGLVVFYRLIEKDEGFTILLLFKVCVALFLEADARVFTLLISEHLL